MPTITLNRIVLIVTKGYIVTLVYMPGINANNIRIQ